MEDVTTQSNQISVVVPTYRRPRLLLKCIEALLHQDLHENLFEIIIVSDGFDAATEKLIEDCYPDSLSIKFISLQKKAGPAAARNLGWRSAKGGLIVFTDDDCIPDTGWLRAFYTAYAKGSHEEIAFSGKTVVPVSPLPTDYERNIGQLSRAEFITANCACTKKALMKVGGLDERFTMAWREDSDLQFKLMEFFIPIVRINEAVVVHPVRHAPWGVSIKEERKGIFNALLYKKYPRLYKRKIQPNPPWHYYLILFCLLLFFSGIILKIPAATKVGLLGWLMMTAIFTLKRLSSTSHSWKHVIEMIFTSAVIPVVSLYWRFYGSLKFKVLLIP